MRALIKKIITNKDETRAGAVLKPILACLSFIYAGGVVWVQGLYRAGILPSYRPKCPVISIGNITAGGVGKTPLVVFLVRLLQDRGFHPVILTRGYMASPAASGQASDEAAMLSEKLSVPVLVNPDRISAVKNAQDCSMGNIFVLDDGFQHVRLKRDLDIVAIDATNAFGNGYLLPRGLLREPLPALARADIFVLTKTDLARGHVEDIRRRLGLIKPGCVIVETVHAPVAVQDVWANTEVADRSCLCDRVVGLCAIGSPGSFEEMLRREGAQVEKMCLFDDHHAYTAADVRRVAAFCIEKKISKIVTTDKDAVKLRDFQEAFQGVSLLVLEIEIKVVHGQTEFFSRVDRCVNP